MITNRILSWCIAIVAMMFARLALAQDVIAASPLGKAADQMLSTGIVGAIAVVLAYMLRVLYIELKEERVSRRISDEKHAEEMREVAVKNAELVAANTQALRELREELR